MECSRLHRIVAPLIVAAVVAGTSGCSLLGGSNRDSAGAITASASINVNDARVGDCLGDANTLPTTVTKLGMVPCSTTHNGEVYAVTTDATMVDDTAAKNYCLDQFQTYIGVDYNDSSLDATYIQPNASDSKKILTCIVYHKDGTTDTGSLKGTQQ